MKPNSDAQKGFIFDDEHEIVVGSGGQGAGKTHAAIAKAVRYILRYPGAYGMFVAADYGRYHLGLKRIFDKLCPSGLAPQVNQRHQVISLANGCEIYWRSAVEPTATRASELAFAVYDEAALNSPAEGIECYETLQGRLRQGKRDLWLDTVLVPKENPDVEILRQVNGKSLVRVDYFPQMWITTTPRIGSWFNQTFDEELNPDVCQVYKFHTEDNEENVGRGYIQRLARVHKGPLFEQEAHGEFVGAQNLTYPTFDPKLHTLGAVPQEFKLVVAGVDWGWNSSFAIEVVGFSSTGVAFVIDEFTGEQVPIDKVVLKCQQMRDKWGAKFFFCDASEPALIAHLMRSQVPAFKAHYNGDKMYRVAAVAARFERQAGIFGYRLYISNTCKDLIKTLKLSGEMQKPGVVREVRSQIGRDDPIDALEYAITDGERMMGVPFCMDSGVAPATRNTPARTMSIPMRMI